MSKSKKWQKTLNELQISDNERQSVKNIMSRLRGNAQIEDIVIKDQPDLELPDQPEITLDQQSPQQDQPDQQNQRIKDVIIPTTLFPQNPVLIEPHSENAVTIDPSSNRTPSLQTPVIFHEARGYKSLNMLDDEIMPTLGAYEQLVLRRLYRLSYGFNKQITDPVTLNTLANRCNLSESTVKRSLRILVERKLIEVQINKTGERFGNRYLVLTGISQNPILLEPSYNRTATQQTSIIDDDHDDLKRQDHHQSEHEKSAMMIYQNITQNNWTKADSTTYNKIKNIPLEAIETAIKLATQRAASRPNSLAYFVKEIIATANPPKQNRSQRKKALEKIVQQVRNSFIGSNYSMSDFTYKVKDLCLRDDIAFDNDIFDEIMSKKNG